MWIIIVTHTNWIVWCTSFEEIFYFEISIEEDLGLIQLD